MTNATTLPEAIAEAQSAAAQLQDAIDFVEQSAPEGVDMDMFKRGHDLLTRGGKMMEQAVGAAPGTVIADDGTPKS
jgi:hypothetical protein